MWHADRSTVRLNTMSSHLALVWLVNFMTSGSSTLRHNASARMAMSTATMTMRT